jgi:4-aminobutyrate aminotransferase-like enzyme
MARSFSAWKAQAVLRLIAVKAQYRDNPKVVQTIDNLIAKLQHLKLRDLHSFLATVNFASQDAPELLSIVPSEEEVVRWFGEGEGEE